MFHREVVAILIEGLQGELTVLPGAQDGVSVHVTGSFEQLLSPEEGGARLCIRRKRHASSAAGCITITKPDDVPITTLGCRI